MSTFKERAGLASFDSYNYGVSQPPCRGLISFRDNVFLVSDLLHDY